MWKGSTLFERSLKGPEHYSGPFLALCGSFMEKQYTAMPFSHCPAVREKVSKRRRKGELKILTARFDLF